MTVHPVDRFLTKIEVQPSGCWYWMGARNEYGHGVFNGYYGRTIKAYRFAYEMWVGSIPDGLELDHLCRNPPCVNPDHLEPVTHKVNMLRGDNPPAQNARKTHCIRGHPFFGDNLLIHSGGGRRCRECKLVQDAKYREANRELIRTRDQQYYAANPAPKQARNRRAGISHSVAEKKHSPTPR